MAGTPHIRSLLFCYCISKVCHIRAYDPQDQIAAVHVRLILGVKLTSHIARKYEALPYTLIHDPL